MSQVDTAVVMASGHGSRFFPITKSVNKAMLPLANRPVVDYLVDQLIEAGVGRIIFHVSHLSDALVTYYSDAPEFFRRLSNQGVSRERIAKISMLHEKASFEFVAMADGARYGTSLPLHEVAQNVDLPDQFLLLNSDAVFIGETNPFTQMLGVHGILVGEVEADEVANYGILDLDDEQVKQIVEKPAAGEAPSNLANLGVYSLGKPILEVIASQLAEENTGEYMITDAINEYVKTEKMIAVKTDCEWLDCGTPENLFQAWERLIQK